MFKFTKSNSKLCGIAVWAIMAGLQFLPVRPALATVMDLDNLAALNASLLHQYTFEGASVAIREEDKKGTLHLDPVTYGAGVSGDIQYQTGFDPTSTAVVTSRLGGDLASDFAGAGGTGLSSTTQNISFPGSFPNATIEMLVRPDESTLSGSQGGIGFAAMIREPGNVRGYFLYQGSASGSSVDSLSTLAGSAFDVAHEQNVVSGLDPGSWYYVATTYDAGGDNTDVEITSYVANLTLGETTLTTLGPKLVTGVFTSGGGGTAPLGVGIGDSTGAGGSIFSAFPGGIDSLGVYSDLLSEATLQSHLDALWLNNQPVAGIPEPSTCMLLLGGLFALRRSKRKRAV